MGASVRLRRLSIDLAVRRRANNAPSQIAVNQLLDGDARGGRIAGRALFADQVPANAPRAGQFIGPFASLFEAYVGGSPQRQPAHLRRSANAVGQIPRLDAARRDSHRQSFAPLIRNPIRRRGRPQSLD
jgi:hypothetical protein